MISNNFRDVQILNLNLAHYKTKFCTSYCMSHNMCSIHVPYAPADCDDDVPLVYDTGTPWASSLMYKESSATSGSKKFSA